MKTKILIIAALLFLVGCRSRKVNIEKTLVGAEVERVMQVEKRVEEVKKKDSVKVVEKRDEKKETETNLHVEFDPKKNDSLEVNHVSGGDSLRLRIKGNGIVIFDYKKNQLERIEKEKQLFGSETLARIDSVVKEKSEEKAKVKAQQIKKDKKATGFGLPIYIIIGLTLTLIVILTFISKKIPNFKLPWKKNENNN